MLVSENVSLMQWEIRFMATTYRILNSQDISSISLNRMGYSEKYWATHKHKSRIHFTAKGETRKSLVRKLSKLEDRTARWDPTSTDRKKD